MLKVMLSGMAMQHLLLFLVLAPVVAQLPKSASCAKEENEDEVASLLLLTRARAVGEEDAKGLVSQMTREEKYSMVNGAPQTRASWERIPGWYIGSTYPIPRLGIPALNINDAGNGFRDPSYDAIGTMTSWPCSLGAAATWSDDLIGKWGVELGREFHAKGANVLLGPGLNVHRVARGGRNAEYLSGESPYLGARLAKPYVKGVQSKHVLAVAKHYIGNQQETNRKTVDSIIDLRTLWEVYYQPFIAAVEAGSASIMCSYNYINGASACGSDGSLLRDLKSAMGFTGWVMSDWWATYGFTAVHGLDQNMPGNPSGEPGDVLFFNTTNLDTLSDAKLDNMVERILTPMLRYGLLQNPTCTPPNCGEWLNRTVTSPSASALALEIATASVLLLKNEDKVLPIRPSYKRIALLGSVCNESGVVTEAEYDNWMYGNSYVIGGSGRVVPKDPVTILQGFQKHCHPPDCELVLSLSNSAHDAITASKNADISFMCGSTTTSEDVDRANLSVDQQSYMVRVAKGAKQPLVALTLTPGAIIMPWLDHVRGAVNLFLAGKPTGDALANVVFGTVNPSGKSPITFPQSENQTTQPCMTIECNYTEGVFVGWHGLEDQKVNFPFGHGLSYTSFSYELRFGGGGSSQCAGAEVCLSVRVSNSGDVAGVDVPQLYLGFPEEAQEPPKVLRGFARTALLQPGKSEDAAFPLRKRDLQIFDIRANAWRTPDGEYRLFLGSSSRDIHITLSFHIMNGTLALPS